MEKDENQFQPVKQRRPKKVAFRKKRKVTIEGAEAAPIQFYIGNTNPRATHEIISEVLKKCALDLADKVDLDIL